MKVKRRVVKFDVYFTSLCPDLEQSIILLAHKLNCSLKKIKVTGPIIFKYKVILKCTEDQLHLFVTFLSKKYKSGISHIEF